MPDGVGSSGDKRKSTGDDARKVPVSGTKNNGPPLQQPGTPMAVVTGSAASQPWRGYLDQILGLCRNSAGTPEAKVFQPPPELLATTQSLLPAEPGPRSSDEEDGGDGGEYVGRGIGNPDENEGGVLQIPALPSDAHPPVLVLLDMNGTLLYRAKKPLPIIVPEDDGRDTAPAFIHGDPLPLHYYMRPGAKEFVAAMVRHPRVCLAFYTSMRGVNAIPAARFLMPDDVNGSSSSSDGGKTGPEVYDRPFNAHDPEGANPWDTMRNLPMVWSTPGRAGEGFGPGNTVMVDDTPRKMRFMNAGLVVVPEYTEASVVEVVRGGGGAGTLGSGACEEGELRRGHHKRAHRQVEVMPRLTEYMIRLLERSGEDVRPFIADNSFLPHAPSTEDDPTSGILATVNPRSLPLAPQSPARKMFGSGDQGAFCFVDAVGVLLTSGPLVRLPRQAADAQGAESPEGEVGDGRFVFDGFPRGLEASVVNAVTEVLRAACDAARRWGLPPSERERLAVWSGVAANGRFSS